MIHDSLHTELAVPAISVQMQRLHGFLTSVTQPIDYPPFVLWVIKGVIIKVQDEFDIFDSIKINCFPIPGSISRNGFGA